MAETIAEIDTWVFDLDNTLYPASSRLFDQVDRRMGMFIAGRFDLPSDQARALQKRLFRDHGTTLRGLMTEYDIDAADFLDFVHEIDLSGLAPQPMLAAAIDSLPGRKVIMTNASTKHAVRVLSHIGIDHHFEGVLDIAGADFTPKPAARAYEILIDRFDIVPNRAAMVEDIARNLEVPHQLGMTTVWVSGGPDWARPERDDHIHHVTDDLAGWLHETVKRTPRN